MPNRILTNKAAQRMRDESDGVRELLAWVMTETEGSARVIICPIAERLGAPGALVTATLAVCAPLSPAGLKRSPWQPAAPPGMVEIWYPAR